LRHRIGGVLGQSFFRLPSVNTEVGVARRKMRPCDPAVNDGLFVCFVPGVKEPSGGTSVGGLQAFPCAGLPAVHTENTAFLQRMRNRCFMGSFMSAVIPVSKTAR